MIFLVGGDLGIFLLSQEPVAEALPSEPETEDTLDLWGEWKPIPWPKRKKISAVVFTIQARQIERIKAKVNNKIKASVSGAGQLHRENLLVYEKTKIFANTIVAGRLHEDKISAHEKTKIYARGLTLLDKSSVIYEVQDVILKRVAETEKKNRDMRDMLEIIAAEVI